MQLWMPFPKVPAAISAPDTVSRSKHVSDEGWANFHSEPCQESAPSEDAGSSEVSSEMSCPEPREDPRHEEVVFEGLGRIVDAIVNHARAIALQSPSPTLNLVAKPSKSPASHRNNSSRPDAYLLLKDNKSKFISTTDDKDHWEDIAVSFEFKKGSSEGDRTDNEKKIIWNLHSIMREDLCHHSSFGVTIENTQVRLWFTCRTVTVVSEPFNFFTVRSTNLLMMQNPYLSWHERTIQDNGWLCGGWSVVQMIRIGVPGPLGLNPKVADAPLSNMLYSERLFLKPFKFLHATLTGPFRFQQPEELLEPLSEEVGKLSCCFGQCSIHLWVEWVTLVPYLDPIVQRLLKMLNPGVEQEKQVKGYTQEQNYASIMLCFLNVLPNADSADHHKLRVKAMECASLIGWPRIYWADSPVDPSDTLLVTYLTATWAKICQVLRPEFEPFLPVVTSPLLNAASAKADMSIYDAEDENYDRKGWEMISMDSQIVGIRTSTIDEKCQVFDTRMIYCSILEGRLSLYLTQSLELTLPALLFYFHEAFTKFYPRIDTAPFVLREAQGTLAPPMIPASLTKLIYCIQIEMDTSFISLLYKSVPDALHISLADKQKQRSQCTASELEYMEKLLKMLDGQHPLLIAIASVQELGFNQWDSKDEGGSEG
ncbi:hypothetical protein BU15DRAFT_67549 [Melanogaster broomeanus]|nr:hypothetical protein BU15DRAFT_67549 [Melanogaster broomeanus]